MTNIADEVVECIKVIADKNRCETCDCLDGDRLRFRCGHCYCENCVAKVEHCLHCLTPPDTALQSPFPDDPATKRAQNAARLLKTFEDTFDIDVCRRSRISEQLKVEREVFPDCIQAPIKYHNKSRNSLLQFDKENTRESTFLPGEHTSSFKAAKMENSLNFVQNWLETNAKTSHKKSPRKPFHDLNVNSPTTLKRRLPRRADIILDNVNNQSSKENLENSPKKKRKTSSFKPALDIVKSQSLLDRYRKPVDRLKDFTKIKKCFDESPEKSATKLLNKTDKDESGIVIDDVDDPIVIDDTQSPVVDKDKQAWLAVLEANERSPYVTQSLRPDDNDVTNTEGEISTVAKLATPTLNVPFIKRSYLIERCDLCSSSKSDLEAKKQVLPQQVSGPKDVLITIESAKFITTIKMSTVQDQPVFEKKSVPVQTDACDLMYQEKNTEILNEDLSEKPSDIVSQDIPLECKEKEVTSQDLFTAEMRTIEDKTSKFFANKQPIGSPQVIIEDSDSDDANESSIIQVTAEVHHSSEQLGPPVLAELDRSEVQQRENRSGRGITPNSTDSSDKENFDPNKIKKRKPNKKDTKKRQRFYKIKNQ